MHAIEKILAKKAGLSEVHTGDIVNCEVDTAGINDLYLQTVRSFYEVGAKQVVYPERTVMFLDHYAPASTITQASNQKEFRRFCKEQGILHLMDIHEGVCHQILADKGFSKPGKLIVVTDSHTTTHGAFGAFGTGVGATDMATILATGKLWFRVPEVIKIEIKGHAPRGVYAKDIILHIIGQLKADYGVYRAVEFTGEVVGEFSISERMALCNMTTEMGAKAAYIQPDAVTMQFLKENQITDFEVVESDSDFDYEEELSFDISSLQPQLAAPASVDNVVDLEQYEGTKIDQAYLGSCTGGRLEDIAVAAKILKGKKVSSETRMVVVPASQKVFLDAIAAGYISDLVAAGATMVTPSCAACLGTHQGLLAPGEVCISSTNRNFPGRMGSTEAKIFLGSPAAVAIAALKGVISDPTPYV